MSANDRQQGAGPAPKEFLALTHGQEWVTFYESFDKLVQDHLSRSSDLLRKAMTLPEVADREVQQVRGELEAKLTAERDRNREVLAKLKEDLGASRGQVATLAAGVGGILSELESLSGRVAAALATYEHDADAATAAVEPASNGAAPAETAQPAAAMEAKSSGKAEATADDALLVMVDDEPEATAEAPADDATTAAQLAESSSDAFDELALEVEAFTSATSAAEATPGDDALDLAALAEAEPSGEPELVGAGVSGSGSGPLGEANGVPGDRPRPHWLSVTRVGNQR